MYSDKDVHDSMMFAYQQIGEGLRNREYRGTYRYVFYLLSMIYFVVKMEDRNEPDPPIIRLRND